MGNTPTNDLARKQSSPKTPLSPPTSPTQHFDFVTTYDDETTGCSPVKRKLLQSKYYASKFKRLKPSEFDELVNSLSDADCLKREYLKTHWAHTTHKSQISNITLGVKSGSLDKYSESISQRVEDGHGQHRMKIKFAIADMDASETELLLRKVISPISSQFNSFPDIGIFHSALIVGPYLLEWNSSAVCFPRACDSERVILTANVATIEGTDEILRVVDQIAKFVTYCNTNVQYSSLKGDCTNTMNCQDFVDCLLRNLQLQMEDNYLLEGFMRKLRSKGQCKLTFYMDQNFIQKFDIGKKKITFKTHTQVDQFVRDLLTKDPKFRIHYSKEYNFLKSFDRAMWIKYSRLLKRIHVMEHTLEEIEWHLKYFDPNHCTVPEREEAGKDQARMQELTKTLKALNDIRSTFCPSKETGLTSCPFGDPSKTSSYSLSIVIK